ncbi:MAG: PocR ligand-binding domain-containing protein, partial [Oscillospiraceae bacterium]
TLTDFIEVAILQQIQDAFSDMTGMAALTTDADGNPVTRGSNFTDFCMKYTRQSELGLIRCEGCDKRGAEITLQSGKPCAYYCHAGLMDFAAPIMANGVMIGSFIGGQVLPEEPELEKFEKIAKELDINPEEYKYALKSVRIASKETIDKAARSLYVMANVLSNSAYKSHSLMQSNLEIEKASNMKSDFLANMSHEIRTPMNAILGMVDLALREEMSPAARDFIKQIKVSGKNLLVIINDILDFSKIEAGKMDIIEADYEPLSVINDVASIVNSRIGIKDIEFTMDIPINIPKKLMGDNYRIHQIMINLLNNAVKFTQQGEVHLGIECEVDDNNPESIVMKVDISDTGIGIKKEDLGKLFNSFQQVDSKRNRNIEGTGLGLAISKQLLSMMDGTISVQSEYGKGTTFTFTIPQKIVDSAWSIPKFDEPKVAVMLVENEYVENQLCKDLSRIGVSYTDADSVESIFKMKHDYIIVEEKFITDRLCELLRENPDSICIAVTKYTYRNTINDIPNMKVLRKPVYSLGLYNAMGISEFEMTEDSSEADAFSFTAPDARVLIVDDNSVNLTVAEGLLEPLEMRIDTAESAQAAIQMLKERPYDLIFMDHMMPEVDGVEATHIIRRLMPEYDDVPIIALTANAVNGAREMFIKEGMNDFVAKPIEINDITAKLRRWLPSDKIIPSTGEKKNTGKKQETLLPEQIDCIDKAEALKLLGSEALYKNVLKEYFCSIDKKADSIEGHFISKRIREYTIEVHALKSSSKQIGAMELSALAADLEKAGNENNFSLIEDKTPLLLAMYRRFKEILAPIFPECVKSDEKQSASPEQISAMLDQLQEGMDNFDTLQIDEMVEQMAGYSYPEEQAAIFSELKTAADNCDIDACGELVEKWRGIL